MKVAAKWKIAVISGALTLAAALLGFNAARIPDLDFKFLKTFGARQNARFRFSSPEVGICYDLSAPPLDVAKAADAELTSKGWSSSGMPRRRQEINFAKGGALAYFDAQGDYVWAAPGTTCRFLVSRRRTWLESLMSLWRKSGP